VKQEGWLIDANGYWVKHFHRDPKSWPRDIRVYIDDGRRMPNGEPPLLKSRRCLRHEEAEAMWRELLGVGWQQTHPQWGEGAEP